MRKFDAYPILLMLKSPGYELALGLLALPPPLFISNGSNGTKLSSFNIYPKFVSVFMYI